MKKLLTILFFLFSLAVSATDYFIKTGGGTGTGLNDANAWSYAHFQTIINGTSYAVGDRFYLKRGDTFNGAINPGKSGTAGNEILISAYGSGAKPIITTRKAIVGWNTSGNWVDQGTNRWLWASVTNPHDKSWRLWLNGIEYAKASASGGVTSVKRTNHLTSTNNLYVYATSNPATFYTNIEYSGSEQQTIYISNRNYITLENLDVRAGMGSTIDIDFSTFIIIQDCEVGIDASGMGIRANGTCNDITIRRNTIDSGDRFEDDFNVVKGVLDGVWMTGGCNRWKIYQNRIRDWGHSNIEFSNITATAMTDNEVYENWVSAQFVDYCRGIGCDSQEGTVATGNKVYRNLFENHPVRIQLNLPGLEFYYNIINNTRNSAHIIISQSRGVGQGLDISGYSNTSPTGIKVYNNVIANSDEAGLLLGGGMGTYNNSIGNLIRNNIFYNNGKNSANSLAHYQIVIGDDIDVQGNTFENNLMFKSGITDLVYYGHDASNDYPHTIAEFNAENGTASDVISANIGGDPLFIEGEFKLLTGSPAIGAALDLGLLYSSAITESSTWPLSVYEGGQPGLWNMGAYLYGIGQLIIKGKIIIN